MPYITLLSDFGLRDASVAIAKGILMDNVTDANIIDISHEVHPFHLKQAAYLLGAAYKHFPAGTFHLPLFDIFSSRPTTLFVTQFNGHYFLAPDNGLIPLALREPDLRYWRCFETRGTDSFHDWLKAAGRMIQLLLEKNPEELALSPYELSDQGPQPKRDQHTLYCEVIHIDKYENVVIDFTRRQYDELYPAKQFRLEFNKTETIEDINVHYTDVKEGYRLCRFNSNDQLEISINHGKAASLFGLRLGGKYNDIKITGL